MPVRRRLILIGLGFLAAFLILAQLILGQLILAGQIELKKAHQHSGYLTVTVVLIQIATSIWFALTAPEQRA